MILLGRIKVCETSWKFLPCFLSLKKWLSYLGRWEMPSGYETGILVYNSAANKKVPLLLKRKSLVSWYMCGPTVYAESHIGHASCYVKFDIIRRILENLFHIDVNLCLGITDIDDKIINKSNETGVNALQLAKKFEFEFFEDMKSMRVLPPTSICRVSENIPQIISFCKRLIDTDYAYVTNEGNVYFMVSKGVTADVVNNIQMEGHTDPSKRDQRDFALWKAAKPNEPFWESPWSKGRPGWHIECSAMASEMFGCDLDLHSGGYDLLFPHHTNEKSQSEAFHGCSQWGNYWMHAGLLQMSDDVKMSKSLGNTIFIRNFLKEHSVNDFRILCLQSLYRKNLFYNSETLCGAKGLHKKFHCFLNECESYISGEIKGPVANLDQLLSKLANTKERVASSLLNDFNTSHALLCLTDLVDDVHKCLPLPNSSFCSIPEGISTIASIYFYINRFLEALGISIVSKKKLPCDLIYSVDAAVEFRNKVRLFAACPNDIGLKEHECCLDYVENAYKRLHMKLHGICQPKEHVMIFADISTASEAYYIKACQFAEKLDQENTVSLLLHLNPKDAKKNMAPLFSICDDFRSSLVKLGFGIKDRGSQSSWAPLIELEKNLSHSC